MNSMGINLAGLQAQNQNTGIQEVKREGGNITLNLSKGIELDLSKSHPNLRKANVGLGWTVPHGVNMDLDVFAFALHNGKILDTSDIVFFRESNRDTGKGIVLSGDNKTGEGDGDDEVIFIDLDRVPQDVTSIAVFANIYNAEVNKQNFGMVKDAYIRLVNGETDKEEAIYLLNEEGSLNTAFKFADLVRNANGWSFNTVGKGLNGDIQKIANDINNGLI